MDYYNPRTMKRMLACDAYYIGIVLVHLTELIAPPASFPYLFETVVCAYAFCGLFSLWIRYIKL
jgi:hypothetical protein